MRELKEAFAVFDKDSGGSITYDELGLVLRSMLPRLKITDKELKAVLAKFDKNGDGEIDFDEFQAMMKAEDSKDSEVDELKAAFQVFDKDGDGTITAQEIHTVMTALGEQLTMDTCRQMVASVDLDGNGSIDFDEFQAMMKAEDSKDSEVDELKAAFQVFDKDGDGTITAQEIHTVMTALGEQLTMDTCRQMVASVDLDGNGSIDFAEFRQMMMDGPPKGV